MESKKLRPRPKAKSGSLSPRMGSIVARCQTLLMERGAGNVFRGWRKELDQMGEMKIGFQHFCEWCRDNGFRGDAVQLFQVDGDGQSLSFDEVAPEGNELIQRFKLWVKENFQTPEKLFLAMDDSGDHQVTEQEFRAFIKEYGFDCTEQQLMWIFQGCDFTSEGIISMDELEFLEADDEVRHAMFFTKKRREEERHAKLLQEIMTADKHMQLPQSHRLAERPWMQSRYPHLPVLRRQKQMDAQRIKDQKAQEAKQVFIHHLRSNYGYEVRGWRRGLDPKANFFITETEFRRYCRKIDHPGEVGILWAALDKDEDGEVCFEDLCSAHAVVLANFRCWAHAVFQGCAKFWDCSEPQVKALRSNAEPKCRLWASDKKLLFEEIREVLQELDYPWVGDAAHIKMLLSSLDCYSCGFVSRPDFEWLDMWEPPEWLIASPDYSAWAEIRSLLIKRCGQLIRAWCILLDTNSSNRVSWREFRIACDKLKYTGNAGGAWRVLDKDATGLISLKQVDQASHDILISFKEWADQFYGSVHGAFRALDRDNSGTITYSELRKACEQLHWQGKVRLLFDCLGLDRKGQKDGWACGRVVTMKEIAFLDKWDDGHESDTPLSPKMRPPSPTRVHSPLRSASSHALHRERLLGQHTKQTKSTGALPSTSTTPSMGGRGGSAASATPCIGERAATAMSTMTSPGGRASTAMSAATTWSSSLSGWGVVTASSRQDSVGYSFRSGEERSARALANLEKARRLHQTYNPRVVGSSPKSRWMKQLQL